MSLAPPPGERVPAGTLPPHLQALLDPSRPLPRDVVLVPDADSSAQLLVAGGALALAGVAAAALLHHFATRLAPALASARTVGVPGGLAGVGFDAVASTCVLVVVTLGALGAAVRAVRRRAAVLAGRWRHGVLATPDALLVHRRDGSCRVFPRTSVRALGSHLRAGDHGAVRKPAIVWRREDGSEGSYLLDMVRADTPEEARLAAWVRGAQDADSP